MQVTRPLLALFVLLAPLQAMAALWEVDTKRSQLSFTGTQSGEPFTGRFTRFTPEVALDPAAPEKDGRIAVTVEMASLQIADKDQAEALPTQAWFATERFPVARYESTDIRKLGDGRYRAEGTLTLKGATHPVALDFTLEEASGETVAKGSTTLRRDLFGVGDGDYARDDWIAYPVAVSFTLVARRAVPAMIQ